MPEIVEPDNLYYAFWKASKGKRQKRSVLEYQANLGANIMRLRQQLIDGGVAVGDYHYFKVYEPKERQICASAFRERVLHHALMNVCHQYFERALVYDSYASRKGKGQYKALERAKLNTKKHEWYLKLDVRKFFDSLSHGIIKKQLCRLFKEQELLGIFFQIIDSYEASPSRGVPIGNLTSQYFANHYLSGLDHYIKEELRVKAYVRYMDDLVLWSNEKEQLLSIQKAIEAYLIERLSLQLKPFALNKSVLGLPFLGYRVFPHYVRLLGASKKRFKKKLSTVDDAYKLGEWSESKCQRHSTPLLAFTFHASTLNLRQRLIQDLGQAS